MFYWLKENGDLFILDRSEDAMYEVIGKRCSKMRVSVNSFLKFHPYIECIKTSDSCQMIEKKE